MNRDDHLIFEAFKAKKIAESTNKLKYTYEIATANLPRDIDTSTKEGELKVLDLAYQELLKYFSKSKNPTLAARNTLNDEDMPGEIVTQYNLYKRDGFPGEERAETPQQYAQDSEKDYPSQKLGSEDAESPEQKQERIARKWELNKQRWDKWKKENPEKAKLNAQRKAGIYGNKEENAEMPQKDFLELKKHINKGPIQIKKPSKELPYTHKYIHQLAKQDSREGQREENAENHESRMKKITDDWVNTFYRTFGPGRKEEMENRGQDPYKFFVDYYIAFLKNPDIVNKFANIYNDKYPSHQIDLNRLHKEIDEIKDKPIEGYRAPSNRSENEERRIDPKCWKGYHKQGTKLKGGVRVNNCVKNS